MLLKTTPFRICRMDELPMRHATDMNFLGNREPRHLSGRGLNNSASQREEPGMVRSSMHGPGEGRKWRREGCWTIAPILRVSNGEEGKGEFFLSPAVTGPGRFNRPAGSDLGRQQPRQKTS